LGEICYNGGMWHKLQWLMLYVVRPVLVAALIINGIPPTIRAIGSAVAAVAKSFHGK